MTCLIKDCTAVAEKDGYCNKHYYRTTWLDNSNPSSLGFVKFTKAIVPTWVRNEMAGFQEEVFYNFFQMYDPARKNKYDRLMLEIAFRGGAKTTGSKMILLYVCCFGLEKFVIYCSETNTFAVQDVFEVRRELGTNPYIRHYFGKINSKAVKGQDGEWSRDAYLTSTGTYVLARGVGQQIRSALRNSYRPTLALINDMDSKNTVKTEYTRTAQQSWFFNDMFNAVDDIDGKVFMNGTIIHEDTVPVIIKSNKIWKTLEYPIMDVDDFHNALKSCVTTEKEIVLPSDEVIDNLQSNSKLAWKDRLNLKYILTKYSEAYSSHQIDGFYQEYFHIVVPPTAKNFVNYRKCYMRYFNQFGHGFLAVKFGVNDDEIIHPVRVFFGVDPASSTSSTAKYSVIAILMMNHERQVFYYGYSRGRYGLRDELKTRSNNSDLIELERAGISRVGIVDEELRLALQYRPSASRIETTQAQQHVYTEILRLMQMNNASHVLYSDKPTENKIDRDAEMLVPDFQTQSAFINYGLDELEQEMKSFPRGTTIDIIDAFYHARAIAYPSENIKQEDLKRRRREKDEYETSFHAIL